MTLHIRDLASLPTAVLRNCDAIADRTPGRFVTDSREAGTGDVFVSFRGVRTDAHDFVADVLRRGAMACVVELRWWRKHRDAVKDMPLIVVSDSMKAYGGIAKLHRAAFDVPLVGVTGSNGKTSSREMIAAVLRTRFRVLQTEGNLNNHIGLPATLLRLGSEHQVVVTEMGTNQPGDIAWLCDIARPTHGVITNIGRAHIEKLLSREGIAAEKSALFTALPANGTAILNADEELLGSTVPRRVSRISFGTRRRADVRLDNVRLDADGRAIARIVAPRFISRPLILRLQSVGRHTALNAAAAVAVGFAFGCPASKMKKALESVAAVDKRLQTQRAGGVLVINDSYNANPDSVLAALDVLSGIRIKGRRCAVLADMLELGSEARTEHERIGAAVAEARIPYLFTFGKLSRGIQRSAQQRATELGIPMLAMHFTDKHELAGNLLALLAEGDAVLVKGSRGMRMEETAEAILQEFSTEEAQTAV
jgi:UDP-N-acetylmuramoyl-tripeptide--D-alanyl-D-alanine ligase